MAMFGVMERLFGNTQPQAPQMAPMNQNQAPAMQQPQQPQPGNMSPNSGATLPDNPMVPADTNTGDPANVSPLDQFADLWKPATNNPAEPASMFANVDPAKLVEAAKKTDFSRVISPEMRAAISQGGEAGNNAFMQAMNQMSQTVYAQSALATSKIVEQALAQQQQQFKAMLPGIIKQHTVSDNLRSENPIFSNPAVQPLISAMESQLAVKHPNATASELTALAKQYVGSLGQVFAPAPVAGNTGNSSGANTNDTDWSVFLRG